MLGAAWRIGKVQLANKGEEETIVLPQLSAEMHLDYLRLRFSLITMQFTDNKEYSDETTKMDGGANVGGFVLPHS